MQSAILPQYTFWTDRPIERPTDGIDDNSIPRALTLYILIDSDTLIILSTTIYRILIV